MARLPALLRRVLLFGGSSLLALIAAEASVRLLKPAGPPLGRAQVEEEARRGLFERDPGLITRPRPGARATLYGWEGRVEVQINSLGLRGPEREPRAAGPRILALGDSFTLALQVNEEDTWSARLEEGLRDQLGPTVEVVNGGCDDYGTRQQVRLLRRVHAELHLDAVVLAFFLGNDLRDNLRRLPEGAAARARGKQGPPPTAAGPVPTGGWSHLLHWLSWARGRHGHALEAPIRSLVARDLAIHGDPAALEEFGDATRRALQELADTCEEAGLPCLVALLPADMVVHPERAPERLSAVGLDPHLADLDAPARAVASWTPASLPVVDLSPALRERADETLYLRQDGHWTPTGHRVAAEALVGPVAELLGGQGRGPGSR